MPAGRVVAVEERRFSAARENGLVHAPAVLADAVAGTLGQLLEARPAARHAHHQEPGVPAPEGGVQRREDLLEGEIPGGAEQDEGIRHRLRHE